MLSLVRRYCCRRHISFRTPFSESKDMFFYLCILHLFTFFCCLFCLFLCLQQALYLFYNIFFDCFQVTYGIYILEKVLFFSFFFILAKKKIILNSTFVHNLKTKITIRRNKKKNNKEWDLSFTLRLILIRNIDLVLFPLFRELGEFEG